MKILLRLAAALGLTLAATSASAVCVSPSNVNQMATEIASGVNANRRAQGLAPLAFNRTLSRAAMAHACDMSQNNFFGHTGSDGSNSQNRVRKVGYRDCIVAENLAWGYPQSQQIISGWMNSPGHRTNMMHPRVKEFGVAITEGPRGPNWVLVVAAGC